MKKSILTIFLHSPLAKINQSLCQKFSLLNEYQNQDVNIFFISFNSTTRDLKKVLKVSNSKIKDKIIFISLYKYLLLSINKKENNWYDISKQIYEGLISELDNYNIDINLSSLILFGSTISQNIRNITQLEKILNTRHGINFICDRNKKIKSTLIYYLLKNTKIKVHHICYDPLELQYDPITTPEFYIKYHGYSSNDFRFKRLDSIQYYLINNPDSLINTNKIYDMVFGVYVMIPDRIWVDNIVNDLINYDNIKIYYKNKFKKINTILPREKYLVEISKSKYTLIIRSNEKNTFSISRFIESIYYNCLPLLFNDCNYYKLCESFNIPISFLEENLVVETSEDILNKIKFIPELKRLKIISYLKQKLFSNLQLLHA